MALFYDRDYGRNWNYDRGYRGGTWGTSDRDYGWNAGAYGAGYDRNYKSRWETDYGDPFGDRTSRTPMRVIRGEYRPGYDRNYMMGSNRDFGRYNRDYYETNPMSYDPYTGYGYGEGREGTWRRGNERGYNTWAGRGYDRGWF